MRRRDFLLPLVLVLAAAGWLAVAGTPAANAFYGARTAPAVAPHASVDTAAVASREQAVAVALTHISGGAAPTSNVDVLLGGASARDSGDYWIVTVTRLGLTVLDRPRIVAVSKADGTARDLIPVNHDGEHGASGDGHETHSPRGFRYD